MQSLFTIRFISDKEKHKISIQETMVIINITQNGDMNA
jgi:hypothetical protein